MRDYLKRIRFVLIGLGLLVLVGVIVVHQIFNGANNFADAEEKVIYVSRGQTFADIVDSLEAKGIIRSRSLFVFVAKIFGGTNRMQTGKYVFKSGVSNSDVFFSIREGNATFITVTIPEGLRARSQARLFARTLGIDSARYAMLAHDEEFTRSLGIDARTLEGYLLPDTYSFVWQPDETDVIKALVGQFKQFFNDSLQSRARELAWTTHQVVTFASIVEGEVVLQEEAPRVAGVYHNRLRRGMRLEADPTIQYFLEDGPRRLLYADLRIDHPYNTYRNRGLPPGPVNNPGKGAILASLYPEHNNYLFFVANGEGGHWFASTYDQHLRYVRMYRKLRAQRHADAIMESQRQQVDRN
jgi:UPF0755 protein